MPVAIELVDHEGYRASCNHTHFTLNVGSGERPRSWLQGKKLKSPDGFKITDPDKWTDEGPIGREAICTQCGDGENVEVSFESVDMEIYDMKATLECSGDHRIDVPNTAVAYTHTAFENADFWPTVEDL